MPGPLTTSQFTEVRSPSGNRIVAIPFRATTNGSNVMSLATGYDYGGTMTVATNGNQYTFTIGPFKAPVCAIVNSSISANPNGSIGNFDGTAGFIRVDFAGAQANAQVNGVFFVEV